MSVKQPVDRKEIAFYYSGPIWHESDWIKTLILFFDGIGILLPNYMKGLSFAALTAAIVASLAGKANSISTIFTLDIYKKYIKEQLLGPLY